MFSSADILRIAMAQSAIDAGCEAADFTKAENVIAISRPHPQARRYLALPLACNLISYGSNIVASITEEHRDIVADYIGRYPVEHCFETPNLHVLNDAMHTRGLRACFMAEYFLPDMAKLQAAARPLPASCTLRWLGPAELAGLYTPQWSNALCAARPQLDVLAVGAYEGDTLIGLAGCSADCDAMWQIGVDVLAAHRRRGIAAALVNALARQILAKGIVPFYCAAWSNLASVRSAIAAGFAPAWVELTFKPAAFVDGMNGHI